MARLAVAVDRLAIDKLHGEVRQSVGGEPAVDEPSDVGVLEQREDAAFLDESADDARAAVLNELDGDPLLELPVGALAEEDASHAAAADLANDAERANAIGGRAGRLEERRRECGGGSFEGAIRPVGSQEREDFRAECFVTSTLALDDRRLLIGGKVDGSVEYGIDAAEPIGR